MQLHLVSISPVIHEKLGMYLMNVVIVYLYSVLDNNIRMKLPEIFKMLEACTQELEKFI